MSSGRRPGPSIGYSFPISGGHVDAATLAGRINHTGGLKFVNLANGKTLKLTRFRIVIDSHPRLTAIVNGDPSVRVPILRLDLSKATVAKPLPYVKVGNVGAYLNSTAAGDSTTPWASRSSLRASNSAPRTSTHTSPDEPPKRGFREQRRPPAADPD